MRKFITINGYNEGTKEKRRNKEMKRRILTFVICLAIGIVSMGAFAGCAKDEVTVITLSGSTSMTDLMEALAAEYEDAHPEVRIEVNQGGSSVGISDTKAGLNDFGLASKAVPEADGVKGVQLCLDGIALAVNKNCAVNEVTNDEVFDLYMNRTPIQNTITTAIIREGSSGTREGFNEKIKDADGKDIKSEYSNSYGTAGWNEQSSTGSVIALLQSNTAAVGYISLGSLLANTSTLKALKFKAYGADEYVEATTQNVLNGSYQLQRPFTIVLSTTHELSPAAQGFYDYIMSEEAQAIITKEGCVSTYGQNK